MSFIHRFPRYPKKMFRIAALVLSVANAMTPKSIEELTRELEAHQAAQANQAPIDQAQLVAASIVAANKKRKPKKGQMLLSPLLHGLIPDDEFNRLCSMGEVPCYGFKRTTTTTVEPEEPSPSTQDSHINKVFEPSLVMI